MNIYTLELLQAINNWQAEGLGKTTNKKYSFEKKKEIGNELSILSKMLPAKFTTYSGLCYRKFNSSGNILLRLGLSEFIDEEYSSWTTDIDVAKSFGKQPNQQHIGVIFKKDLSKENCNVIINLKALYEDADFTQAIEDNKNHITNFNLGIGHYKDSQKEIILFKNNIAIDNIVAYSGKGHNQEYFINQIKISYPHLNKNKKENCYQNLKRKHPDTNKKQWVENKESVTRLITLHKIDSILLNQYKK